MYFEVNVTPGRKKDVNLTTTVERKTKYSLVLAPFQPQTHIEMISALSDTAYCTLTIKNTSNRALNVTVTKRPAAERGIALSLSELTVAADSEHELGISWTPRDLGTWRDTIQLTDSRRIKYDIALITSSIGAKKDGAGKRKPNVQRIAPLQTNVSSVNIPNKNTRPLLQKSSLNTRPETKRLLSLPETSKDHVETPNKKFKPTSVYKIENKENISANVTSGSHSPQPSTSKGFGHGRELGNTSPAISHDFSAIMDSTKFALSPLRPPQPTHQEQMSNSFSPDRRRFSSHEFTILTPPSIETRPLRRETYVTAPVCEGVTFNNEDINNEFEDSLSPQDSKSNPKSDFSMLVNGLNFTSVNTPVMPAATDFSPKCCSTESRNAIENSLLSSQESMISLASENNTFDMNKSASSQIIESNGTYELPKSPIGAIKMQHIRPTRLSRNFTMLSPVMPVADQVPRINASSSSPIYPNNLAIVNRESRSKIEESHSLGQRDSGGAQAVLEADLWAKPATQYIKPSSRSGPMSLEMITEERSYIDKSITTNKTYTKELNKTDTLDTTSNSTNVRIEISPPKRLPTGKIAPIRRISPKKCGKVCKEKGTQDVASLKKKVNLNTSGYKSHGKISIPGVRISKLSLAGVSRKKTQDAATKTSQMEVSVKLHDPNDFLSGLCNPDPFAATTTEDPFLASTLYYDDRWVHNQEMEFKKWLNALLTPPEHLTADVDTACIDVAKVWQSCRMKEDVAPAETREALSARYHTNTRLNSLRKAACQMLRSSEVVSVLSKITVCAEKGILVIRQDRDLTKDIGLQKEVLELFLCYNPLWLRIGLEAIYGETIPLQSNNDLVGLSRFLITRFFSDPFIAKAHSHPTVINLRLPTFTLIMNKFMLKKFLFLVYFLDHAKRNKLIGHDPCLFHKRGVHKESRQILLTFAREVLSGVGDVTKVLRPYGYLLSHKQTVLDEYDYAVVDMCVDLRDGVRLCRVMELITNKRFLTSRCRLPAISRLQKVHNVDVALTALHQSGYVLQGDIDAKSIADGHREKTLSMLWQIIYKFQAPRFHKAAATVQNWWRSMLWWVRVKNFLKNRRENAACVIQRTWRYYLARKQLRELKENFARELQRRDQATRVIQLRWASRRKMLSDRNQFQQYRASARMLQKWWRNLRAIKPFTEALKRKRNAATVIQRRWRATKSMKIQRAAYINARNSAVKIQQRWRLVRVQKAAYLDYQNMRKAASYIQSKWRANRLMKAERICYQRQLVAIKTVQQWWRCTLAMKRDRSNLILMKGAVLSIEKWWLTTSSPVGKERQDFLLYRRSAMTIQRAWKTHLATRSETLYLQLCRKSCIRIQAWWRCVLARREYNLKRGSCLIVQRWWRSVESTRDTRACYVSMRKSAITIQTYWRMWKARNDYLKKKNAVLAIESWYSRVCLTAAIRSDFLEMKVAAETIQSWWRNLKISKAYRVRYLEYRRTVTWIQARWRANHLSMKARESYLVKKQAACKIQASWRSFMERRRYLALRNSVLLIQRAYRLKMRLLSAKRNSAAIILQRKWRATLAAREEQIAFKKLRTSVVDMQRRWRANKIARSTRSEYILKKNAAITIQKNWRAFLASKSFNRKKRSSMVIQSWWRNKRIARKERDSFLSLKTAAICFQRRFRSKKIASETRKNFVNLRNHVVSVQRRWRAILFARTIRQQFIVKREAAILVQSKWKMVLAVRKYAGQRKAAAMIQSWWRAKLAARKAKSYYESLRTTTVFVQRRYRANKLGKAAMQEYNCLKRSVILMQRRTRANRQMRMEREDFIAKREAAVRLQRWWKSVLVMRECQNHYKKLVASVITIQRWYRASVATSEQKQRFSAAMIIQRRWRQILYKKQMALQEQNTRNAVVIIERWRIRVLAERHIRNAKAKELERKVAAATLIQTVWRGHKVREAQPKELKELRQRSEKAKQEAQPTATIACRQQEAIALLNNGGNLSQLTRGLTALDTICRMFPKACVEMCEVNLVEKVYSIFYRSNRSLPWMGINLRAASILISIAKFPPTKSYVWQEKHVDVIIRMLGPTVERDVDLFLHLTTLLWLLADDPEHAKAIVESPMTTYTLGVLYNTLIKKRNRRSSINSSFTNEQGQVLLPNVKPDWGVKHKRPRLFTTVHHAITALCRRLKIKPSS